MRSKIEALLDARRDEITADIADGMSAAKMGKKYGVSGQTIINMKNRMLDELAQAADESNGAVTAGGRGRKWQRRCKMKARAEAQKETVCRVSASFTFEPQHLAYLHDISRARGIRVGAFLSEIIADHMERHEEDDAELLRISAEIERLQATAEKRYGRKTENGRAKK